MGKLRSIATGAAALVTSMVFGAIVFWTMMFWGPAARASEQEAVAVPGTQVVMPIPGGFVLSEQFSGFEDSYSGSTVLIVEMPAEAFKQLDQGLTAEALSERGITMLERRDETVGELPAIWISGTQSTGKLDFEKRLLLLGGTVTVLLTATIPQTYADPPRLKRVEEAMRAARLAQRHGTARDLLPFTFDELDGFRFMRTLAGRAAILVEEEPLIVEGRPAVFMVSSPLVATCADYEGQENRFGRQVLAQLKDFSIDEVLSVRRLSVGRRQGIEHVAGGTSSGGEAMIVVQTLLFDGCSYLRSVGMAPRLDGEDESQGYLPRFRALAKTLRLK